MGNTHRAFRQASLYVYLAIINMGYVYRTEVAPTEHSRGTDSGGGRSNADNFAAYSVYQPFGLPLLLAKSQNEQIARPCIKRLE